MPLSSAILPTTCQPENRHCTNTSPKYLRNKVDEFHNFRVLVVCHLRENGFEIANVFGVAAAWFIRRLRCIAGLACIRFKLLVTKTSNPQHKRLCAAKQRGVIKQTHLYSYCYCLHCLNGRESHAFCTHTITRINTCEHIHSCTNACNSAAKKKVK